MASRYPLKLPKKWDEQVSSFGETVAMKKPSKHLIAEVPRSVTKVGLTIAINLGMSGAITARSTKMEKWLTGAANDALGSRVVVSRPASGADRDGDGDALDLGQRTAP